MAWFVVDDKFHSHPKVKSIPRGVRAEALGTWTLCGAYSADHLLDGFVPAYMVDDLGGTEAGVAALLEVKLWRKAKGGFRFVGWEEWQQTREQIEQKRAANRERQRKARERSGDSAPESGASVTRDSGVSATPPSHPIHTQPSHDSTTSSSSARSTTDEDSKSVEAVDKSGDSEQHSERIRRRLEELAPGADVPWTMAVEASATILARKTGDPPRLPTRYVLVAINRDPHAWANYARTGRLPAA